MREKGKRKRERRGERKRKRRIENDTVMEKEQKESDRNGRYRYVDLKCPLIDFNVIHFDTFLYQF